MVELPDISLPEKHISIYNPACGTGGMLSIAKEHLPDKAETDKQAEIYYGNSLIPHSEQGREPGNQLAGAQHKFDFMLSNPPFGVTWGGKDGYEKEARKYQSTRYQAGMPRTNDGALLFLQTMLAKMKRSKKFGLLLSNFI